MTGYQEVLTDPSYRGQIVAMTAPQIGNYGTNTIDTESETPHVRAFVIEELSSIPATGAAISRSTTFSIKTAFPASRASIPARLRAICAHAAPCGPA